MLLANSKVKIQHLTAGYQGGPWDLLVWFWLFLRQAHISRMSKIPSAQAYARISVRPNFYTFYTFKRRVTYCL